MSYSFAQHNSAGAHASLRAACGQPCPRSTNEFGKRRQINTSEQWQLRRSCSSSAKMDFSVPPRRPRFSAVNVFEVLFTAEMPSTLRLRRETRKSYKYDSHQSRLRAFTPANHLQSG